MRPPKSAEAQSHTPRPRLPSAVGYIFMTGLAAAILFFLLWWMLHGSGDEAPWVPAGLAASVVILVAAAAREVVVRRAWTRYVIEQDRREHPHNHAAKEKTKHHHPSSSSGSGRFDKHAAALRALQKQSAEADADVNTPSEVHLDLYRACEQYLARTTQALRSVSTTNESRIAMRAAQERVRALQKHHLVAWARGASRALTYEAQRRIRMSDKIETAMRAGDVIESALKIYPEEPELRESAAAVQNFIASVKVRHWVELAERAAFRGQYRRAIDRYRDALFYLSRENMKDETREDLAARIGREIELLRVRLATSKMAAKPIEYTSQD